MDSVGYMNKAYFFVVTSGVEFAASVVFKKFLKVDLGLPTVLGGAVKTSLVLAACAAGVGYAQEKRWIPNNPFSWTDQIRPSPTRPNTKIQKTTGIK